MNQASEMAIGDTGYIAPEQVQPGISNMKGDTYAFGVLLLELFTGRKPFDRFNTFSFLFMNPCMLFPCICHVSS